MVEHLASGRHYSTPRKTKDDFANANRHVGYVGGMLALFSCCSPDAGQVHYRGEGAECGVGSRGSSLNMNWSEFFSMGGYGFYVWGSYLSTLILLVGEVLLLKRRKNSLRKREDRAPH